MENVYRRELKGAKRVERIGNAEGLPFKKLLIKQGATSLVILALALSINMSPEGTKTFEKNIVKFILSHNTDFKKIPDDLKSFARKYFSEKETKTEGKEVLLNMVLPLEGVLQSPFGMRQHPTENVEKFHYGVDISAPEGEKIVCSQKGVAKEILEDDEYGKHIIVDHGEGIVTLYAHCSEIIAKAGDEIQAGQMIAKVGSTGTATGPHLHFEIRDGENWLNPEEFINFK